MSEALTGVHAGWVLSREKGQSLGCRPCLGVGKATISEPPWPGTLISHAVGDPKQAWKQLAREPGEPATTQEARLGRIEKSKDVRR